MRLRQRIRLITAVAGLLYDVPRLAPGEAMLAGEVTDFVGLTGGHTPAISSDISFAFHHVLHSKKIESNTLGAAFVPPMVLQGAGNSLMLIGPDRRSFTAKLLMTKEGRELPKLSVLSGADPG